jgi:hypothetical protein
MPPWLFSRVALGLVLMGPGAFTADALPLKNSLVKAAAPAQLGGLSTISDWKPFILAFRRAVRQRDRGALLSAMDDDFFYNFEGAHKNHARDRALERWDHEGEKAWAALEKVLRAGSREDPEVPGLRVSPPAWVMDERYAGYRAGFMQIGPYWRWIWFVSGED